MIQIKLSDDSLRKTYAHFLKSNNVHVTTAAKLMGHSNPPVTHNV